MKAERWIVSTLCLFAVCAGGIVGSSYVWDIFGIFRDPTGRQLSVNEDPSTAKFFLNERYVPTNYDAIIIGSSSTVNWDMSKLDFAHFYNESVAGANMAEEKRIIDQALPTAHFKYAICLIGPYPMASHELNNGRGKPTRIEALGSINVLREEWNWIKRHFRHMPQVYFADGSQSILSPGPGGDDPMHEYTFRSDPQTLQELGELLDNLRARGVKIIFVQAPFATVMMEKHHQPLVDFYASFPLRHKDEPLIDLGGPRYLALRSDPSNWMDNDHLNDAAAKKITVEVNAEIHKAMNVSIAR